MYVHSSDRRNVDKIKVAELFAGVGGFRLGLEGYTDDEQGWHLPSAGNYKTVWANQWEPGTDKRQFAARCYEERFEDGTLVNEDIEQTLDEWEAGERDIPNVDMVVGGFPCQDYSVARSLKDAKGIEGKKGVLWWSIYRFLKDQLARDEKSVRYCLFENVDRLLKSPAKQRGRDFAIILSCLADLGYSVEWMVVNSGVYGFNQRRKRVYIFCERAKWEEIDSRLTDGIIPSAFPIKTPATTHSFDIPFDPVETSERFGTSQKKKSPFGERGVMVDCHVVTCDVEPAFIGESGKLANVLVDERDLPAEYFVRDDQIAKWEYLKGSKHEERAAANGHVYTYSEGAMSFPDDTEKPARTILTGEGGTSPSRFKHVIRTESGRLRRLIPDELDQLQGFPKGWTDTGMTDGQRAFCMGNALVVGIPHAIGVELARRLDK